jgi:hypothetical protein
MTPKRARASGRRGGVVATVSPSAHINSFVCACSNSVNVLEIIADDIQFLTPKPYAAPAAAAA